MRESVRHHFDPSLVELKEGTIHMAGLVLENIHRTSEAILENRLDLVERVISADDEVDRRYAALEQQLFEVVARQQPVAGDLRFLISLARMLHEVERCGDLAVNTAKALDRAAGFQLPGGAARDAVPPLPGRGRALRRGHRRPGRPGRGRRGGPGRPGRRGR